MSWQDYLNMSTKQRRNLTRKANRGDREAMASLKQYTREIKNEVNSRLAKLEKSNIAYGKVYNNVQFFTQTQYGSNRFKSPTALNYDALEMALQNDIGVKFLKSKSSTVSGVRSIESNRLNTLQENGILPDKISKKRQREFLQFLGNEEISASIDEYGNSEVIVEMFYDAYSKGGSRALTTIKTAMSEFLSNRITFDDAMGRVGIKIEDYMGRRPTS